MQEDGVGSWILKMVDLFVGWPLDWLDYLVNITTVQQHVACIFYIFLILISRTLVLIFPTFVCSIFFVGDGRDGRLPFPACVAGLFPSWRHLCPSVSFGHVVGETGGTNKTSSSRDENELAPIAGKQGARGHRVDG